MTDEEATKTFLEQQKAALGDIELQHGRADAFVTDHLQTNGFPNLAKAYYNACQDFWYA